MALAFQKFKLGFISCKDSVVIETGYQESKDCIGFVVVYNEETYISFEGHEWKQPGEIIV